MATNQTAATVPAAEHGTSPTADWTGVDHETWTNLHLTTAA